MSHDNVTMNAHPIRDEYPTEKQARERELARILWVLTVDGNAERAARLKQEVERDEYRRLEMLRTKLTSWPAMFSKRYEVVKALALGWWYQLTVKEQRDIVDGAVVVVISVLTIAVFGWLAVR